ncbi:hypothetical protein BDZ97DRAFT_1912326 [Flammula alnicola]|nr:hypothetical protein BDZ97DRAFT_1912326 [Flammula alnicola]
MDSNTPLPMVGYNRLIQNPVIPSTSVDTKADPPRSIWTHPFKDEQYLNEHPDVRNKVRASNSFGSDNLLPLPSHELPRRHSFNGRGATPVEVPPPKHKEGFFKKMKTKAIHSMEQHNERKRQQLLMQQQQQQRLQSQFGGNQYISPQSAYPQTGYSGMGYGLGRRGGMGGMGGMGLPLMGGMAGGLLLGDLLGNNNNGYGGGGGDWGGGGDFGGGGGDWSGGGGDGGGFGF